MLRTIRSVHRSPARPPPPRLAGWQLSEALGDSRGLSGALGALIGSSVLSEASGGVPGLSELLRRFGGFRKVSVALGGSRCALGGS